MKQARVIEIIAQIFFRQESINSVEWLNQNNVQGETDNGAITYGEWRFAAHFYPIPIEQTSTVATNDYLYVFGMSLIIAIICNSYVMVFTNYFQVVCLNLKMVAVKTMLLSITEKNVTRILIHPKDMNGSFMEIFSVHVLLIKPPFSTDNFIILQDMPKVISIGSHIFLN